MSSSLFALKAATDAGTAEQKRLLEKRRNIMVLIHQHLIENGYIEASERLQHEAGPLLGKFEVADNVDLGLILNDFESYYEMRFNKKPKIVRKSDRDDNGSVNANGKRLPRSRSSTNTSSSSSSSKTSNNDGSGRQGRNSNSNSSNSNNMNDLSIGGSNNNNSTTDNNNNSNNNHNNNNGDVSSSTDFGVTGNKMNGTTNRKGHNNNKNDDDVDLLENRILKPPPKFGADVELTQLAAVISREIYQHSPNVLFDDIVSLEDAKTLLREAVQLPLKFPMLFTGLLRPWRGILLHGPPGTGKTMLAKAVATECRTTFFNISASVLVSKWRGDSEKLVRALFELARYHAPSTIFLDEIDSILSSRGGDNSEHEASRRMKTELLVQMDGLASKHLQDGSQAGQVFVMAASNLPWDLDVAVLRRLEKRVLVPLPDSDARHHMLSKHLNGRLGEESSSGGGSSSGGVDLNRAAELTNGYSGADLELLCREAAMRPVRRLMSKLATIDTNNNSKTNDNKYLSNSVSTADVTSMLKKDPITEDDLHQALSTTRPSNDGNMNKYLQWQKEFGSV